MAEIDRLQNMYEFYSYILEKCKKVDYELDSTLVDYRYSLKSFLESYQSFMNFPPLTIFFHFQYYVKDQYTQI